MDNYFKTHREELLKDFFTFLKFQSISSEPDFSSEVLKCCDWLRKKADDIGFTTEVWETEAHPVLFASDLSAGEDKPTLLLYNHYDVQPVDPLELWDTPPFEPTLKGDRIFARGAQDNKGQCFYVLAALQAYKKIHGSFPFNIKWVVEGDEEVGSSGLLSVIKSKSASLKADWLVMVDLGIPSLEKPCITLGLRGIVTMDLLVQGPHFDLHSGHDGGVAKNPVLVIADLIARAHDKEGKVAVEGFYEGVEPLTAEEKEVLSFEFDNKKFEELYGVKATGGEKAFSPRERGTIRPTLEVNGINGGYSGSGFKTIIPAKASAKISCRLVAGQDPIEVGKKVKNFFESNAPEGVSVKVDLHDHYGKGFRTKHNTRLVTALQKAYEDVFKLPCHFELEGGSIPVSTDLADAAGAEVALIGLGMAEDQMHAPNESFDLNRLEKGFTIIVRMIDILKE